MNLYRVLLGFGLLSVGVTLSSSPAQAFSFKTNLAPGSGDPTKDIMLDSVTFSNGQVFNDFSLVSGAKIIHNDEYTGGNTGAASSDKGDKASGVKLEKATDASVVQSLGNLNLNNIIDTEDTGSFTMNLSFETAVSNLFFWERGSNSKLGVQALDAAGNLIGKYLVLDKWSYAGYSIDTTEVSTQKVGSLGVSLADLGLAGPIQSIQITAMGRAYNGPDFKVVGGAAAAVPEPATMAGLALAGAGLAGVRRRQQKQAD
ncbi:MAG TPA: PEP-CTERM sorting domain-containing protein [Leptolyngbyaceae cyanobacterium M33_DOE_097]|uniref:PEP-CTERM sorting domain-containing protein n=1 Tax=Oscillatoriales cyanobacterium SpSt-418 TaxID=2282169 RepID=A0A7C3PFL4_9CYAN|nr:PEP-CTERM sorting domain-containing protein [Leptolyngbyaceae cyanobacterium M33_DOE_097]